MNTIRLSISFIIGLFCVLSFYACDNKSKTDQDAQVQDLDQESGPWWDDATMYEVNIRQYTPEGTFKAFQTHLDRLEDLGIEVLWIMPIHPIGKLNRKGSMGSYYSVQDYKGVSPDYGTAEDFKELVEDAHSRDMKVIIDWVANHTSWDHHWVTEHPEWYSKDETGKSPTVPFDEKGVPTDWTDVADLNYDNAGMRLEMIASMKYWLTDMNIDGFRCDVAHWVPVDFWSQAITQLTQVNSDILMLAESDYPPNVNEGQFVMDYGWEGHHYMNQVTQGKADVDILANYMDSLHYRYRDEAIKLNFVTNHDENSWNGTIEERMGGAGDAMAVLAFTMDGMPLIYSGQEAGLNKRLAFFKKDQIDWTDLSKNDWYKKLVTLKKKSPALAAGITEDKTEILVQKEGVLAFKRVRGESEVWALLNFSEKAQTIQLTEIPAELNHYMSSDESLESLKSEYNLPAFGYAVFMK